MSPKNNLQIQVAAFATKLSQPEFVDVDVVKHQRCANFLNEKIKSSDEALTPDVLFVNCSSQLTAALEKVDVFIRDKNLDYFNNSLENLQNSVAIANQFIVVFGDAGHSYYGDTLNQFTDQVKSLTDTVAALKGDVNGVASSNKKLLDDLGKKFNVLVDGDPDSQTIGWSKQVTEALTLLEQRFSEELYGKEGVLPKSNKIYSQLEAILVEGVNLGKIIGVDGKTKKERSEETLRRLQRIKQFANDVLGKIGLGASVGGYQRRANQEAALSQFWTALILCTIGAVFYYNLGLMSFLEAHLTDTTLSTIILIRALFAIPFISFMVYAGFKAKNHRKMELRYRQFELELAAFEPNLAKLDEDLRSVAKLAFIQRTFGRFDHDGQDIALPSLDTLKEFSDYLKRRGSTKETTVG